MFKPITRSKSLTDLDSLRKELDYLLKQQEIEELRRREEHEKYKNIYFVDEDNSSQKELDLDDDFSLLQIN